jgi:hypothetical protein
MRKYTLLCFLLFCTYTSYAQTLTNVSGTIISSDGQTWNNGNITFTFNQNGTTPPYFSDGVPFTPTIIKAPLDNAGHFTGVMVPDNTHIVPVGTAWGIQVCPQSNSNCYVLTSPIVISGTTMDITLLVRPPAIVVSPIPPASAYQDLEVNATRVGSIYYNLLTQHYRLCTVTVNDLCTTWINICLEGDATCGSGGGGGTVGPGTVNQLSKFLSVNNVGDSTCSDDGTNPTRCPNGMNTAGGGNWVEWLVDTGGVQANKLVCRTNAQKAQICPAGTTQGVIGVAQSTVASGGTAKVCFAGKCNVIAATNTTTNDWLIPSVSVAGEVDDVGATKPTSLIQTIPAETTVTSGNAVLTTFLSLDTAGAGSNNSGTVQPCTQYGLTYYLLAGLSTTVSCITPPTTNGQYFAFYNVTSNVAVAPQVGLPGVPINPQVGTTYTKLYSDRVSLDTFNNASPVAVTIPQSGTTGFNSNYVDANWNRGTGLVTLTPTTSTINGNANQILPSNWFGTLYSNNTNYFMPVFPTIAAFPSCLDSAGNHLNFNSATGAFICGTTVASASHGLSLTIGAAGGTPLTVASTTTDYITVPFACTINAYNLVVDVADATFKVKFWKIATGTAIPTSANSINTAGVGVPSGTAIHSTTLSDFTTTAVAANDILAMNVTITAGSVAFVNGVLSCPQ